MVPEEVKAAIEDARNAVNVKINFNIASTCPVFDRKENKEFTAYVIDVTLGEINYTLLKRYSQFDELHAALKKAYKGVDLPLLPKKRWFGNTDPSFVQKRCRKLQLYLNSLALNETLFKSTIMCKFLLTVTTYDEERDKKEEKDKKEDKDKKDDKNKKDKKR